MSRKGCGTVPYHACVSPCFLSLSLCLLFVSRSSLSGTARQLHKHQKETQGRRYQPLPTSSSHHHRQLARSPAPQGSAAPILTARAYACICVAVCGYAVLSLETGFALHLVDVELNSLWLNPQNRMDACRALVALSGQVRSAVCFSFASCSCRAAQMGAC